MSTSALHRSLAATVLASAVLAATASTASATTAPAPTSGSDGSGSQASPRATALKHFQAEHHLAQTGRQDAATTTAMKSASAADNKAVYASATDLNASQRTNARTVIAVGKGHNIPRRGIEIALMTAMQESKFVNYTTPVDHDSLGIFQQRPSTGWGTKAQITNVVTSTQSFYGVAKFGSNPGLLQISGWQSMDRGTAAQKVQVSEYPDAYAQWQSFAISFYDQQAGSVSPITGDSGSAGPGPAGPTKYYVDTISAASVYASPTSTTATGTLNKGTNYVYCKAAGRKITHGSAYNHYWLKTDPDSGPANQWVSAYYLAKWGNDEAKDNSGKTIPDC